MIAKSKTNINVKHEYPDTRIDVSKFISKSNIGLK